MGDRRAPNVTTETLMNHGDWELPSSKVARAAAVLVLAKLLEWGREEVGGFPVEAISATLDMLPESGPIKGSDARYLKAAIALMYAVPSHELGKLATRVQLYRARLKR